MTRVNICLLTNTTSPLSNYLFLINSFFLVTPAYSRIEFGHASFTSMKNCIFRMMTGLPSPSRFPIPLCPPLTSRSQPLLDFGHHVGAESPYISTSKRSLHLNKLNFTFMSVTFFFFLPCNDVIGVTLEVTLLLPTPEPRPNPTLFPQCHTHTAC